MSVTVIAEAGVNHNGSLDLAYRLIDGACEAGADMVKFQTFRAADLTSKDAPKASYQRTNKGDMESQYEMLSRLELSKEFHYKLIERCNQRNIEFFSTAFDINSLNFLNDLNLNQFKIPSGELTNLLYLEHVAKFGKPIIISSGMASIDEIGDALNVLEGAGTSRNNITVLHCNTAYPTPFSDVNLRSMVTIKDSFNVKVGYSDHTLGIVIPIAAVALGASVIEKHFTIDRSLDGPDHKASLVVAELKQMVQEIRVIEVALGAADKPLTNSERENILVARKSIVAIKPIKLGEKFDIQNIGIKRPGTGISPMRFYELIGMASKRNYNPDELIEW
jgi:N,N'-diacetyllegionaminate synthase